MRLLLQDYSTSVTVVHIVLLVVPVLSKVDDFAAFKKVEVHAKNSTFQKVEVV